MEKKDEYRRPNEIEYWTNCRYNDKLLWFLYEQSKKNHRNGDQDNYAKRRNKFFEK